MSSAEKCFPVVESSCDPGTHVRHLEEDSLQRVLIVMCIIAALTMAALKPARSASIHATPLAAAQLAATAEHSLCRMPAGVDSSR
jgi:hypothetical protein